MVNRFRGFLVAALVCSASFCSAAAYAGSETLLLVRGTLTNDTDAAGLWQYEGGKVENAAGASVGTYIVTRRVTTSGASTFNTAAVTTSLFFPAVPASNAPHVITLQGSHSFTSGIFAGSVSGASNRYHWIIDADANATIPVSGTTKLTLTWTGSNQFNVP